MLHHSEVAKHNKAGDLWVIVNGNAYDLSDVRPVPSLPLPSKSTQPELIKSLYRSVSSAQLYQGVEERAY
jgi:hypothetical protein